MQVLILHGLMQVLILHGWQGSGDRHWQTWLARRLTDAGIDVRYPLLPDPDKPNPADWDTAIGEELQRLDPRVERVVVCHSLACISWLRRAAHATGPAAERVLLVAPPSPDTEFPEVARFFPVALDPGIVKTAAAQTRLVCADDDPYCPEGAAARYGEPLAVPVDLIPGGGHLNPESGYGPWPSVEAWVRGETAQVTG